VVRHHEHAIGGAVVVAVRALAPDDIVAVELGEARASGEALPAGATAEVTWAVRPATDSRGGDAVHEEVRSGEVVRRHRGARRARGRAAAGDPCGRGRSGV
jgi:hypothetical protein